MMSLSNKFFLVLTISFSVTIQKTFATLLPLALITLQETLGIQPVYRELSEKDQLKQNLETYCQQNEHPNLLATTQQKLIEIFRQLQIVDEITPTKMKYLYAIIDGSPIHEVDTKIQFLIKLIQQGVQLTYVLFTGTNKLLTKDKDKYISILSNKVAQLGQDCVWREDSIPNSELETIIMLMRANLKLLGSDLAIQDALDFTNNFYIYNPKNGTQTLVQFITIPSPRKLNSQFIWTVTPLHKYETIHAIMAHHPNINDVLHISVNPYKNYNEALYQSVLSTYSIHIEFTACEAQEFTIIGPYLRSICLWLDAYIPRVYNSYTATLPPSSTVHQPQANYLPHLSQLMIGTSHNMMAGQYQPPPEQNFKLQESLQPPMQQDPRLKRHKKAGTTRNRTTINTEQLSTLKKEFQKSESSRYPSAEKCEELSKVTSLPEQVVQTWFKNQRAKLKKEKLAIPLSSFSYPNDHSPLSSNSSSPQNEIFEN